MSEIWLSDANFYVIKVKESFDELSKAVTSIIASGGWIVVHYVEDGEPIAINPRNIAVIKPTDDPDGEGLMYS